MLVQFRCVEIQASVRMAQEYSGNYFRQAFEILQSAGRLTRFFNSPLLGLEGVLAPSKLPGGSPAPTRQNQARSSPPRVSIVRV